MAFVFLGTKNEEYLLRWDPVKKELFTIPYDPQLETAGHNTIKFVRFLRCKNENVHAALKQANRIKLNRAHSLERPFKLKYHMTNSFHGTLILTISYRSDF